MARITAICSQCNKLCPPNGGNPPYKVHGNRYIVCSCKDCHKTLQMFLPESQFHKARELEFVIYF